MSADAITNTPPPAPDAGELGQWQRYCLIAGGVGLAGCLLALVLPGGVAHFFRAWLVAVNLFTGAAVGSVVILMVQYLTGGQWGFVLRRTLEASSRTLPLMALLFLPLLFGTDYIFPWARYESVMKHPELVEKNPLYADTPLEDHELDHKYPYLNYTWWLVRAIIIFGVWGGMELVLNRWSTMQDRLKSPAIEQWCEAFSGPGLVVYMATVTLASIDWGMSLEPWWYSTIYGAIFGMGQVLTAMAVCVAVFMLLAHRPELEKAVAGQNMSDLGTLLGAFVIIWAYLAFMQFIIIWMGQIPEELPWYHARMMDPNWRWVAVLLIVGHFALPFALLMSFDIKRNRVRLAYVALWVCLMRVVDYFWLLIPAFTRHDAGVEPAAISAFIAFPAAVAAVGGAWSCTMLWQLGQAPLLPAYQPETEAAHGETAH